MKRYTSPLHMEPTCNLVCNLKMKKKTQMTRHILQTAVTKKGVQVFAGVNLKIISKPAPVNLHSLIGKRDVLYVVKIDAGLQIILCKNVRHLKKDF